MKAPEAKILSVNIRQRDPVTKMTMEVEFMGEKFSRTGVSHRHSEDEWNHEVGIELASEEVRKSCEDVMTDIYIKSLIPTDFIKQAYEQFIKVFKEIERS